MAPALVSIRFIDNRGEPPKGLAPLPRLSEPEGSANRAYLINLRATRPPPTSNAPAPSANSEAVLLPPVGGSAFIFGAGAGAAFGGGGGGAAFGGGGGAGLHGALATTPPAFASII